MLKKVIVVSILIFVALGQAAASEIYTYPDGNVQMIFGIGEIADGIVASGLLDVSTLNIYFVYQKAYSGNFDAMIFFQFVSTDPQRRTMTWQALGTENGKYWQNLGLQTIKY